MTEPLPELTVKVTADVDDAVEGLASVEAAEKGVGDQSDKTTAKVKKNQKDQGTAVSEFDRLYKASMKDGEMATQSFSRAIEEQKTKVKELQSQFKSGSGSTSVFGDLKQAQSDLGKLKTIFSDIGGEGEKAGSSFVNSLDEKISEMGKTPYLIAGATSLAAGITPIIAAAVSAGFSIGVVGVGVMALKNDPRVKAAASGLKDTFSETLTGAAQPLLDPLITGISELEGGIAGLKPELTGLFSAVGPDIEPLVQGVVGLAKSALPGFTEAATNAQPIIAELGADLPQLGAAFGDALNTLSKAPGVLRGVDEAFTIIDGVIRGTANTISFLTSRTGELLFAPWVPIVDLMHDTSDAGSHVADTLVSVAQTAGTVATSFDSMGDYTKKSDDALKALIVTENAWMKQAQSNDDALLAMKEAQTTFDKELKTGTKNWDENTAAGQKQVGNLNSLNEKITSYYAGLAAGQPLTEKQTAAELKATSALYDQAKQAGATKSELATLKGEVKDLSGQLASLHGKTVTVTMVEHFIQTGAANPANDMHGHANSGIAGAAPSFASSGVMNGGPRPIAFFAEQSTKREAFVAERGDRNNAVAALREAGSWHGMDMVPRGANGGPAASSDIYINLTTTLDSKVVAKQLIGPVNKLNDRSGVSIYGSPAS